jgi:hypothetical protein
MKAMFGGFSLTPPENQQVWASRPSAPFIGTGAVNEQRTNRSEEL